MSAVPTLRLVRPRTLDEALSLRDAYPEARLLAGGTDLLVNLRRGLSATGTLIDLSGIADLQGLTWHADTLRIGAGVTLERLAADIDIASRMPALTQAALAIAGPTHRASATVGGNLCLDTRCRYYNQSEWWRAGNDYCLKYRGDVCHVAPKGQRCYAAFCGDLAPALLALDAEVEVAARAGTRRLPLAALYRDDGADHLTLAPGEILSTVIVPWRESLQGRYEKVRIRGAIDFPLAGVAVAMEGSREALTTLRVACTGTDSRPVAVAGLDTFLHRPVDHALLAALENHVRRQTQPMRTMVTPTPYRRHVLGVLARRMVSEMLPSRRTPGNSV